MFWSISIEESSQHGSDYKRQIERKTKHFRLPGTKGQPATVSWNVFLIYLPVYLKGKPLETLASCKESYTLLLLPCLYWDKSS